MDAVEAAYESALDRLGAVTLAEFREALIGCIVHPVTVAGEVAGAVIVKGSEVHACILPWAHKRWFGRGQARILNNIIARHGRATTQATTEAGRRFVERLGFTLDGDKYVKDTMYGH
jgi:hypothetical protein